MLNPFAILKKLIKKKDKKRNLKIETEKYKYVTTLRVLSLFVIIILLAAFSATAIFVYKTVMDTIGQVQSITLYQAELRIELIDFNRLDKIETKWKEKYEIEPIDITRNPFISVVKKMEPKVEEEVK